MDKAFNLAIILSAQDKASAIFSGITSKLESMGVISKDTAKKFESLANGTASGAEKMRYGAALAAGAVAASMVAIGVKSIKAAADFQTSTSVLVTSAGESTSKMAMVRQGMLNISTSTGTAIGELTGASGAMYQIESAGFHGAAGLELLKAAAQGAKAEGANVTKVADALSSALTDYHLPASDAATVTSQLVTAVGAGKSNFEAFTGSLHSVLPLAAALHEPLADILGALASMTVHGMSADQATQNLQHTLFKMQNPTTTMTGELAQLGIKSSDLAGMIGKKGLTGTLEDISSAIYSKLGPAGTVMLNAFNGNKIEAQDAMAMMSAMPASLQKIAEGYKNGSISIKGYRNDIKALPSSQANLLQQFVSLTNKSKGFNDVLKAGKNASQTYGQALQDATGDSTTMNTTLLLTGENAKYTANAVKSVGSASAEAGGNVKGWSYIQKNFNQQLSEAKNGLHNTSIALGSAFLPALTKVMSVIVKIITPIATWVSKNQALASILLGVVGGLAALVAVILTADAAFQKLKKAAEVMHLIKGAQEAWTVQSKLAAAAQWALNAAQAASPMTWIILAIIAFIAIMVILIVKVKPVREFFMKLWADLRKWFSEGVNWIKKHWELLVQIILGPLGIIIIAVIQNWTKIWSITKRVFTDIWHVIENVLHVIENIFKYTFLIVLGIVIEVFTAIYNAIKKPLAEAWAFITAILNAIAGFIKAILTFVLGIVVGVWNYIFKAVSGALNSIWGAIVMVWTNVYNFVVNIMNIIVSFLITRWNNLYANVSATLNMIWGAIRWVFRAIWSVIGGTMISIWSTIVNTWNTIYNDVSSIIGRVLNVVSGIWQSVVNVFKGAGSWLLNAGKSIVEGLVKGIEGAAGSVAKAAENVAKGAVKSAMHFLKINSPSKVFMAIGASTNEGFVKGITNTAATVSGATQKVAQSSVKAATNTVAQTASSVAASTPKIAGSTQQPEASHAMGNSNVNLTVKVGMYTGTTAETNQIAETIWQAMNRVANSHNVAFPSIGVLPN